MGWWDLVGRYRAQQWKLPFWKGRRKRLTGKKATGLRDTTRCCRFLFCQPGLDPYLGERKRKEAFENPKGKGKDGKGKKGKGKGKDRLL